MADSDILALKDRAADRFWKISHVDAVGIGGRDDANGAPTGQMVLKIFLKQSTPDDQNLFPATFEGLPVDVVSTAPVNRTGTVVGVAHAGGLVANIDEHPTLRGGVSIATEGTIGLGTLGCVLRDKNDGSAFYGLANYHVVAIDKKLSRSHRVSHPAMRNPDFEHIFDDASPKGLVAEGGLDALRDAAVFRLDEGVRWIPFVDQIGYLKKSRDVTIAEIVTGTFEVRKTGSKTGLTGGTIHAIADLKFENTRQKNVLLILPNKAALNDPGLPFFSHLGDSGAVIVSAANEVVGLQYGFQDAGPPVPPISGFGFAVRIGTVLDLFRNVDGLDLEVAVARNAASTDPNDPAEQQKVPFPAGVSAMSNAEELRTADRSFYRPLIGGSQILAERVGSANAGSLGCVVTNVNDDNEAYLLTSYSALSLNSVLPPTTDTEVGQPDVEKSLSRCCDKFVGKFTKAGPIPASPTAAIVRLKKDQKWLGEIMRIGVLSGSKAIAHSDLDPNNPLTVWKNGPGSRLTSGIVVRAADSPATPLNGVPVPEGAMVIRPHDDPLRPTAEVHFSRLRDRGAAIVNRGNEVVGVLFGELPIPGDNGRRVVHGLAAPIATVLAGLKPASTVELQVFSPIRVGLVKTVMARAALSERDLDARTPATPEDVPEAIRTSPEWRDMLEVWHRHQRELRELIDRNRRVATIWHRSGGPALLQAFARTVRVPGETMPPSVNGVPLALCLDRLSEAFCRYGSTALVSEITRLRSTASSIAGLTLTEILAAFARTDLTPQPA